MPEETRSAAELAATMYAASDEREPLASTRLILPDEMYARVKHAAIDARASASAWIRDAIAERLDGIPADGDARELAALFDALNGEGRETVLRVARMAADARGYTKPGRREQPQE